MRLFNLVSRAAFTASVVGLWLASAQPASAHPSIEAESGTLYLKASPDADAYEALRVATSMQAQITGNVARVHVTQKFSNFGSGWVEGLYVFPLSADAAVDEIFMRVGERTVRGEIQERAEAEAAYAQARRAGKQASIVDQERPNMFTTAVANIAPNSSVSIEITYLETIPYRDSRYSLRLPLAITPRYTPGDGPDPATPERVTAARQAVDISVELTAGFPLASVASLHHVVEVKDDASGKRIHFSGSQIAADHDFELVWTLSSSTRRGRCKVRRSNRRARRCNWVSIASNKAICSTSSASQATTRPCSPHRSPSLLRAESWPADPSRRCARTVVPRCARPSSAPWPRPRMSAICSKSCSSPTAVSEMKRNSSR
jgi:hypothetical protein